ncbi:MAG: cation diffusion facilitator family transporter [Rhodospirillales bacterium]|nr:cation diffusion facilitator family transporter [Rhodospirillales bacterium]MBO6786328.1 cation diffusion facilitator family transporter [Rhodospirillales bacterium]
MRAAAIASVSVAAVLIVTKFAAWLMTDSVSLLSTLIDSFLDAAASLINLLAVHHALQPADREHRFGHGKAEPLASLAQAAFICGSAAFLLIEAGERVANPKEIANTEIGYAVMVFSIVLTLVLVAFQRYVVSKSGSIAIDADSLHYKTDVLINLGVMASLFMSSYFGWQYADPLIAILIAIYIVKGAWEIGKTSLSILMDRELEDDERQKIRDIVMAHEEVRGLHDLRTRSSGVHVFIQFHLELDGDMKLKDAHDISEEVERELMDAFPNAEVIIHEDPEGIEEARATFR